MATLALLQQILYSYNYATYYKLTSPSSHVQGWRRSFRCCAKAFTQETQSSIYLASAQFTWFSTIFIRAYVKLFGSSCRKEPINSSVKKFDAWLYIWNTLYDLFPQCQFDYWNLHNKKHNIKSPDLSRFSLEFILNHLEVPTEKSPSIHPWRNLMYDFELEIDKRIP